MKKKIIIIVCIIVILLLLLVGIIGMKKKPSGTTQRLDKSTMQTYYQARDMWEAKEEESGIYETGFYFLDIDMDGQKELAVQLGGGSMRNCTTNFYQVKNGQVVEKNYFEEGYSLALSGLEKYTNEEGKTFFMNRSTLKVGPDEYLTSYDMIDSNMKPETKFSMSEYYREDGLINRDYYVGKEEATADEYKQKYAAFFQNLKEEEIATYFVSFKNWKAMTEAEKQEALKTSYEINQANYSNLVIPKETKKIDLSNYEPIEVTLTDAVYGKELLEYEEALQSPVSAQIYTDHASFVYVVPAPDLLDNMRYDYQNGRLVAYQREFMGIGGSVTYYFNNGKLISIDKTDLEPEMEFTPEDSTSIIIKSESAWNEYGK